MKIHVHPAPEGMPVASWAVLTESAVIGGFPSADAAVAWAQEWSARGPVLPICDRGPATASLAAFEAHRQRNDADWA